MGREREGGGGGRKEDCRDLQDVPESVRAGWGEGGGGVGRKIAETSRMYPSQSGRGGERGGGRKEGCRDLQDVPESVRAGWGEREREGGGG